ncbi:MAG: hypothetical protein ABIH92_03945 [Nanoarchaeota archaeon]
MLQPLIKETYVIENPPEGLPSRIVGELEPFVSAPEFTSTADTRFHLPQIGMCCDFKYTAGKRLEVSLSVPPGHGKEVDQVREILRAGNLEKIEA